VDCCRQLLACCGAVVQHASHRRNKTLCSDACTNSTSVAGVSAPIRALHMGGGQQLEQIVPPTAEANGSRIDSYVCSQHIDFLRSVFLFPPDLPTQRRLNTTLIDKATLRVIGAWGVSNHSWGRPHPITAGGARVQSQAGRGNKNKNNKKTTLSENDPCIGRQHCDSTYTRTPLAEHFPLRGVKPPKLQSNVSRLNPYPTRCRGVAGGTRGRDIGILMRAPAKGTRAVARIGAPDVADVVLLCGNCDNAKSGSPKHAMPLVCWSAALTECRCHASGHLPRPPITESCQG
jgi:hypothetical protein